MSDKEQNSATRAEQISTQRESVETVSAEEVTIPDKSPVDACVDYARGILSEQLVTVKAKNYDYAPEFRDLTIQHYLIGVMWRFAEGLNNVEDPRKTAFVAIETMLTRDGMNPKKVANRVEFLEKMSRMEDGTNALAVAIGYDCQPGDQSLMEVFDHYVDDTRVSGELWRLYNRGKKTMLYGGLFIAFVVIWFITLFMPGNTALSILAAGLISAALFVIPVFLIGVLIYYLKIKKAKQSG
jgi:hypothetical protein